MLLAPSTSDGSVMRFSHIFHNAENNTHTYRHKCVCAGSREQQSNSLLISLLLRRLCVGVAKTIGTLALQFEPKKKNK